ncbi:MAG: DUF4395 domain-containing protein [Candidatus Limnocylindrales bacterium]
MPSAVPATAAALPPARMIDPRGHRFGAGFSAIVLIASFATGFVPGVALVVASIGVSAAFGLRWSIYGAIWRRIVGIASLGTTEPEHEYPPRFAQTLGTVVLVLALVAFALGASPLGWLLALAVAGLQSLLGITGYCLGCRMYFLRWWMPAAVTRIWTRGRSAQPAGIAGSSITFR